MGWYWKCTGSSHAETAEGSYTLTVLLIGCAVRVLCDLEFHTVKIILLLFLSKSCALSLFSFKGARGCNFSLKLMDFTSSYSTF